MLVRQPVNEEIIGDALKKLFEKSFLRIFKNLDLPKTPFSAVFNFRLPGVYRQNLRCL